MGDLLEGQRHKAPIVGPGVVEHGGDHRDLGVDPAEVGEAGLDARIAADPLEQPAALVLRLVENVVTVGEEIAGGTVALRLETLGKPGAIPWHQEHRLLLVAV